MKIDHEKLFGEASALATSEDRGLVRALSELNKAFTFLKSSAGSSFTFNLPTRNENGGIAFDTSIGTVTASIKKTFRAFTMQDAMDVFIDLEQDGRQIISYAMDADILRGSYGKYLAITEKKWPYTIEIPEHTKKEGFGNFLIDFYAEVIRRRAAPLRYLTGKPIVEPPAEAAEALVVG